MAHGQLYLISANKSRPGGVNWSADDYDVRAGTPVGRVVGRIFQPTQAPAGGRWFWTLTETPVTTADHGYAETREAAMAAFKAQWLRRMG